MGYEVVGPLQSPNQSLQVFDLRLTSKSAETYTSENHLLDSASRAIINEMAAHSEKKPRNWGLSSRLHSSQGLPTSTLILLWRFKNQFCPLSILCKTAPCGAPIVANFFENKSESNLCNSLLELSTPHQNFVKGLVVWLYQSRVLTKAGPCHKPYFQFHFFVARAWLTVFSKILSGKQLFTRAATSQPLLRDGDGNPIVSI